MARIKIGMPANFIFECDIPVRIADINYGNHVGNDAFVAVIHEARMQWLTRNGFTELDIEGRVGLIMADLLVEFKGESFYGDYIQVKIGVAEISKISFELYYQLSTRRKDEVKLLVNAKTGMICFDYGKKKVVSIPAKLLDLLNS